MKSGWEVVKETVYPVRQIFRQISSQDGFHGRDGVEIFEAVTFCLYCGLLILVFQGCCPSSEGSIKVERLPQIMCTGGDHSFLLPSDHLGRVLLYWLLLAISLAESLWTCFSIIEPARPCTKSCHNSDSSWRQVLVLECPVCSSSFVVKNAIVNEKRCGRITVREFLKL